MAIVIDAFDIQKAYGTGAVKTQVLRGIRLEIAQGECVFLAGPSGSGKSTLLSILGCILTPDAGTIRILDQDATNLSPPEQARLRRDCIGFVFQRFHLFKGLSALENVQVAFDLLGANRADAKKECLAILESVGIADLSNRQVHNLSMGQRQRVALARALAGNPPLILADEPTASLDAESGLNAMSLLKRLSQQHNKTVVVVTHDSRIFPLADRILHLESGLIAEPKAM